MTTSPTKLRRTVAAAALLAPGCLAVGPSAFGAGEDAGAQVRPVLSEKLPNVPGQSLTAVVVNYAPGGKSPAHHHAGSVFAFILSGAVRSEVTPGGAVKVYKAGESFFEAPGSSHLVSENASETEPASLLAVFVADEGAKLTQPGAAQP